MAKGPFLEFLRADVKQTAADTFTEGEIPTPSSKTESMAMLIHSIELQPSKLIADEPTDLDNVMMSVTKASKTGAAVISDPDSLAYVKIKTSIAAVFHAVVVNGSQKYTFDPPLLYPKAKLYIQISSAGIGVPVYGHVRIGYTLEKVSKEDFISALVE
ncbi:hypothetical protein ES705_42152 [subsurface metagenome]